MQWQLHLGCLTTFIASVKSKTEEQIPCREAVFVPQSSAAAEQSSPASAGVDLDDPSQMKVGVFSSSLADLQVLFCFCFFDRYPNTINALLSILGIYLER